MGGGISTWQAWGEVFGGPAGKTRGCVVLIWGRSGISAGEVWEETIRFGGRLVCRRGNSVGKTGGFFFLESVYTKIDCSYVHDGLPPIVLSLMAKLGSLSHIGGGTLEEDSGSSEAELRRLPVESDVLLLWSLQGL